MLSLARSLASSLFLPRVSFVYFYLFHSSGFTWCCRVGKLYKLWFSLFLFLVLLVYAQGCIFLHFLVKIKFRLSFIISCNVLKCGDLCKCCELYVQCLYGSYQKCTIFITYITLEYVNLLSIGIIIIVINNNVAAALLNNHIHNIYGVYIKVSRKITF